MLLSVSLLLSIDELIWYNTDLSSVTSKAESRVRTFSSVCVVMAFRTSSWRIYPGAAPLEAKRPIGFTLLLLYGRNMRTRAWSASPLHSSTVTRFPKSTNPLNFSSWLLISTDWAMDISSKTNESIFSSFGLSGSGRLIADKANEFKPNVQGMQLKSLLFVDRLGSGKIVWSRTWL